MLGVACGPPGGWPVVRGPHVENRCSTFHYTNGIVKNIYLVSGST